MAVSINDVDVGKLGAWFLGRQHMACLINQRFTGWEHWVLKNTMMRVSKPLERRHASSALTSSFLSSRNRRGNIPMRQPKTIPAALPYDRITLYAIIEYRRTVEPIEYVVFKQSEKHRRDALMMEMRRWSISAKRGEAVDTSFLPGWGSNSHFRLQPFEILTGSPIWNVKAIPGFNLCAAGPTLLRKCWKLHPSVAYHIWREDRGSLLGLRWS